MNNRILFVFHSNFLRGNQGEHNRLIALSRALKTRGFEIDLFGFEHFSEYSFSTFEEENKAEHLISRAFVYDWSQPAARLQSLRGRIRNWMIRKLQPDQPHMQDWSTKGMKKMLQGILRENEYCAVFNFYNFLTPLFEGVTIPGKLIYFMEDCCFIQQQTMESKTHPVLFGRLLNDELARMSVYDALFSISYDEKIMFEKLTGRSIHFFPHLIENRHHLPPPVHERRWDIVYIGFHNPFNIEALQWFMERVHPLLRKDIRMVFVGNVTKAVDCARDNIELIPYAEDLSKIYCNAKISICPMFHGTGMKIKVVEAMSYGLPVVCNERGVDGLPDKTKNGCIVTDAPEAFAAAIHTLLTDPAAYRKAEIEIQDYFSSVFVNERYIEELAEVLQRDK